MFKIGTLADWFHVGLLDGIRASRDCGAGGVQIYAWNELNPFQVTAGRIRAVRETAAECKQEVTALCGELGGHGFEIAADNEKKIEYLKRTVDLAQALDCRIVTTHIGRIPKEKDGERYRAMLEACREIGAYAAQKGAVIAVETGAEPIPRLVEFISAVYAAGPHIVHTHAKDGRCNYFAGTEVVYGIFAEGGIEALNTVSTYFTETPLGQGEVRWDAYLKALQETGYRGYLTIEREVNENAGADIRLAVEFLQKKMERLGMA